eukprot:15434103-Alexandrium_andersonii.AAC.1
MFRGDVFFRGERPILSEPLCQSARWQGPALYYYGQRGDRYYLVAGFICRGSIVASAAIIV